MTERVLQSAGFLSRLRGRRAAPRGAYDPSFFLRRTAAVVGMALVFVALGALSGTYVGFDFMQGNPRRPGRARLDGDAIRPFPYLPPEAGHHPSRLGFDDSRLDRLQLHGGGSGVYLRGAGLAIGGVGGPFPLIVRAVASLFRNIPVVAWAFILLFSFKQSEFTGFFRAVPHKLRLPDALFSGEHRRDERGSRGRLCAPPGRPTARSWLRRSSP